jgi:Na+-translocating ferredoxin:NAD+ oxidoreductase RnfE subunit
MKNVQPTVYSDDVTLLAVLLPPGVFLPLLLLLFLRFLHFWLLLHNEKTLWSEF